MPRPLLGVRVAGGPEQSPRLLGVDGVLTEHKFLQVDRLDGDNLKEGKTC